MINKRKEAYHKFYEYELVEGSHGHQSAEDNPQDKILQELYSQCLHIHSEISPATHSPLSEKFLWPARDNGVFMIVVDKTSGNKEDSYGRRIEIESMPPNAEMPKGLAKLLKDFEFVKSKSP